jgi:hypothetical protein
VDRDPQERREEPRRPSETSEEHEAANEGREGDRRDQQVPPALETTKEPSDATSKREEPYPHEEERPPHSLERTWWRRMFRGPHETASERRWWEFWR